MIFLDTNVVSETLKKAPSESVLAFPILWEHGNTKNSEQRVCSVFHLGRLSLRSP